MKQKFNEVKSLISGEYYQQAQDECNNGANMSDNARSDFQNIKAKMIEAFGDADIFNDFQNTIDNYFPQI